MNKNISIINIGGGITPSVFCNAICVSNNYDTNKCSAMCKNSPPVCMNIGGKELCLNDSSNNTKESNDYKAKMASYELRGKINSLRR